MPAKGITQKNIKNTTTLSKLMSIDPVERIGSIITVTKAKIGALVKISLLLTFIFKDAKYIIIPILTIANTHNYLNL